VALGQAFQDSQANTFVSTVKVAHRWLGAIHASYAVGCLVGPLIATSIAITNPQKWTLFYWAPFGMGILNLGLVACAFRKDMRFGTWSSGATEVEELEMGERTRETGSDDPGTRQGKAMAEIVETVKEKNVWKLGLFFFFYLGAAITAGGEFQCHSLLLHTPKYEEAYVF
jgi:fucose permease